MNKACIRTGLASLFIGLSTLGNTGFAQSTNTGSDLCPPQSGLVVGFFNGVKTSEAEARSHLYQLKLKYGLISEAGDRIKYELFYNQSGAYEEDFAETFRQRLEEQGEQLGDRWELLQEAIKGGGPLTTALNVVDNFGSFMASFGNYMATQAAARLTNLRANPPTLADYNEHRTRLDNYALEGNKILLVAHSQGNLFLNNAYQYLLPKTTSDSLKAVHVAPASPVLHGTYILADLDLVINSLRATGSVPDSTAAIPGYALRPAGSNGQTDILGHGFQEIYLNAQIATGPQVDAAIRAALRTLVKPAVQRAQAGFFTVTMTWDGTGDVDLHTIEPNGRHVYYATKVGLSGTLDVDNTVANGPEHYYASCDSTKLQEGTYQIGVNNYLGATGRTATFQVASWQSGVLLTRQVGVGAERGSGGDNAPLAVLTVKVTKLPADPAAPAGAPPRYSVSAL